MTTEVTAPCYTIGIYYIKEVYKQDKICGNYFRLVSRSPMQPQYSANNASDSEPPTS